MPAGVGETGCSAVLGVEFVGCGNSVVKLGGMREELVLRVLEDGMVLNLLWRGLLEVWQ